MAKNKTVPSQLTERYALALVGLAQDNKILDQVEADIESLANLLNESMDFCRLITASSISTTDRIAVLSEISKKAKFQKETTNFLNVLISNGRIHALPNMIEGVRTLLAEKRGEITAKVETVYDLTATQQKALSKELSEMTGKTVVLDLSLNSELLGGMIVTIGSVRIDSSVSGRLDRLQAAMNNRAHNELNDNTETMNKKEA